MSYFEKSEYDTIYAINYLTLVSSFRTKIKALLRSHWPSVYPFIYKLYVSLTNKAIDRKRVDQYSRFVTRGFYPFTLGDTCFEIMLDPGNGGVDMDIFADGVYEPEILKLLRSHLSADGVFIDIGANIGQHSLYCSYFCRQVYSFEPVKKLYDQFKESIARNKINNIAPQNVALGDTEGEVPIYSNGSSLAASSIVATKNKNFIQHVKVVRLDDVYKGLGIDKATLVKIDVEGYELGVLQGAKNFIKKYTPIIVLEFSPYFYRRTDPGISQRILDFLSGLGYELYDLGDTHNKKMRISKVEEISNADQVNLLCIPA